jgi:hypothetical protein
MALPVAWAQLKSPGPAVRRHTLIPAATQGAQTGDKPLVSRQAFAALEKDFDLKLTEIGGRDSLQLLGSTRGIYLAGYGTVFTNELSLAYPPAITPFHTQITDAEKQDLHKRKLAHLAPLREAVKQMVIAASKSLAAMPPNEQIVFSVRLLYLPYEITDGLPAEIVAKADRQSAMAGNVVTEDQ